MDTKLKSYKGRQATHIVLVLILALLASSVLVSAYYIALFRVDDDILFRTQYKDSSDFSWNAVVFPMQEIFSEMQASEVNTSLELDAPIQESLEPNESLEINVSSETDIIPEEISEISIDLEPGMIYYYSDGNVEFSNVTDHSRVFFEQFDSAFFAYENGQWSVGENTSSEYVYAFPQMKTDAVFYYAVTGDYLNAKQVKWANMREKIMPLAWSILGQLLIALLIFIYLIATTGRIRGRKEVHLTWLDRIYLEVLLSVMAIAYVVWFLMSEAGLDGLFGYTSYMMSPGQVATNDIYRMIILGFSAAVFVIVTMVGFLSIVRRMKARRLFKNTLFFSALYRVWDFFKSLFDDRRLVQYPLTKQLFERQKRFIIASAALVFFSLWFALAGTILLFVPPILELVLIYWYIKYNNKTYDAINRGFNESLEDQMRAERMKIALVTNVSHDLKTPLTSIISYVDLLSREEELSESARDYVNILSEKSNRLKTIVSDLFDLAKSTSGNLALEMEQIDLKKLVEQTLADMEDEISKSNLKFKVEVPEEPMLVYSDGKKLYRVMQNLLDNTLKYAMPETRVFVTLKESGSKVAIEIKNTAAYEMDFTEEEILQRFTRGDDARSTEGSGLGLSIAESFTQACGGDFILNIDGDLFKVILSFKKQQKGVVALEQ